ncbi:MAG: ABC transporter permease [Anaerolineae bacterium]
MNFKLLKRRFSIVWQQFRRDWRIFTRNRFAVLGVILISFFGILALVYPVLRATVFDYDMYNPLTGFDFRIAHPSKPSLEHLLGTDSLGHDILSMLLAATAPTFVVGIAAALTTACISTLLGVVSAYYAGTVDAIVVQVADAFLLLPAPLFMVIMGMRLPDLRPLHLGIIYGLVAGLGGATIVMRAQALQVVTRPFISAAQIAGGSRLHIILVHVLPHMMPLAALQMMLAVTGAVVADGFIAFFGFNNSDLNWGMMIYSSFTYSSALGVDTEWHVLLPPALALSFFAAAFYFVSRGLHEVIDPRAREQSI